MSSERKIKACETGSGISWDRWIDILKCSRDQHHTSLARVALELIEQEGASKSPEWWAQSCTICYEQVVGNRQAGEQCDGSFSVSVSKTLEGSMDKALETWIDWNRDIDHHDGVACVGAWRTSSTERWRYAKMGMEDGSKINVNLSEKKDAKKTVLSIQHEQLLSAEDVERWRAYWKRFLKEASNEMIKENKKG